MDKTNELLEEENERLRNAVVQIKAHLNEINEILESISDLTDKQDKHDSKVQEKDVISLLKKYSNLG